MLTPESATTERIRKLEALALRPGTPGRLSRATRLRIGTGVCLSRRAVGRARPGVG
jgi:hypothetical protein